MVYYFLKKFKIFCEAWNYKGFTDILKKAGLNTNSRVQPIGTFYFNNT